MNEEQAQNVVQSGRANNALLTTLLTIVAGYCLQQGVTGILWLLCWAATFYGLFVLGSAIVVIVIGGGAYLAQAIAVYQQVSSESSRLQKLNEIYSNITKK